MPFVFRARPVRPAAVAALCVLALSGCEPPRPAPAPAAPPRAALVPALSCMPGARAAIELPLEEGLGYEHPAEPAPATPADCVLALFGERTLNTPAALDPDYAQVQARHGEDAGLRLSRLPREGLQLLRVGATAQADVWLLRIDGGVAIPGQRHDLLFSTGRPDGHLVDQLLVGARGLFYRRDYDLEAVDAFSVREESGAVGEPGPGYRAGYRIDPSGRLRLEAAQVLPVGAGTGD